MLILQQGNSEEVKRGRAWWSALEMQWKFAFNEAVFGKGPTLEPPKDEELITLLLRADSLRFAGPLAMAPNLSNVLTNLSGVAQLTHLTYLSITDCSFTSLQEISNLTKLCHLFVYRNKLSSLAGIENMRQLEELYCLQNDLTSLQPIRKLVNLKTLYANYNKLTSLEGLTEKHSKKLRNFYIEPNPDLPHREIIRVQNEYGILCRRG